MNPSKTHPVMEIFGPTVQGEGAMIGCLTYFIRFGLCDYRCKMCDSMHAVDPHRVYQNAEWLTCDEIATKFAYSVGCWQHQGSAPWVTLSGGNPAIHNIGPLVTQLHVQAFQVAVETQGTFYKDWLWQCDVVTVSPKGPGMGESHDPGVFREFMDKVRDHPGLNLKIVIFDEADIQFAAELFQEYESKVGSNNLYLSAGNPFPPGRTPAPTLEELTNTLRDTYLKNLDSIMKCEILSRAKFLPQFHVWLWGNKQGV